MRVCSWLPMLFSWAMARRKPGDTRSSCFWSRPGSYLFVKALEAPSVQNWAAYIAIGALSLYAHFFGVWVVIAHFVAVLLFGGHRERALQALCADALIAALAIPLLVPILTTHHLSWLQKPSWNDLVSFVHDFTGQGGRVLILLYVVACCSAVVIATRQRLRDGSAARWWSTGFLLTWLLLPIIATVLFSLLVKPIFLARYMIVSMPALSLLAAAGVWLRRNPPSRSSRLWLVLSHQGAAGRGSRPATWLPFEVRRRYCSVQTRTFNGIRVQLYGWANCAM